MQAPVPGVEVADDADRACRRRPDRERRAHHPLVLADVRTELVVELLVAPLADQVQVQLAERRLKRVRVLERELARLPVVDLELVAQWELRALDRALEDAGRVDLLERHGLALRRLGGDLLGRWAQRPDHDATVFGVRAEHRVRVGMLALGERVEL